MRPGEVEGGQGTLRFSFQDPPGGMTASQGLRGLEHFLILVQWLTFYVSLVLLLLLEFWPVCPAEGWVTSEYGYRRDPMTHRRKFHRGVDVANEAGTPVHSPWGGTVSTVARSRYGGRFVVVRSGPFKMTFLHLQTATVAKGDQVERGDQLGLMGSSGRATGPHVHLGMRLRGKTVNPSMALLRCRAPL